MFWIYTSVQKFGVMKSFLYIYKCTPLFSKTTNYKHFNINYKAKYYISQSDRMLQNNFLNFLFIKNTEEIHFSFGKNIKKHNCFQH